VPEDIENYSPLSSEDGHRSYNLSAGPPCLKTAFAPAITDCQSKEEADALRGTVLFGRSATNCFAARR